MSMDFDEFAELVREIEAQGYDHQTALRYASLIGDTPLMKADGTVMVEENGQVLAVLKPLKFFGE